MCNCETKPRSCLKMARLHADVDATLGVRPAAQVPIPKLLIVLQQGQALYSKKSTRRLRLKVLGSKATQEQR